MNKRTPFYALVVLAIAAGCQQSDNPVAADSDRAVAASAATWTVPGDFPTIQAAIDDPGVAAGDQIRVGPGEHAGATVTKGVHIKGQGGATIVDGPFFANHPLGGELNYGFVFPADHSGDGATIEHLTFDGVEFPVFSRGTDDVTIRHNTMLGPVQGVTSYAGSGWTIEHNDIEDLVSICGGGIGVIVGDNSATPAGVRGNVISQNDVSGTLHVHPDDCGGYDGSGIVLFADFRSGRQGAVAITDNLIVKNEVSLTSDTPAVVDVNAVELTDTRNDDGLAPVIFDNAVGFNDLRGTAQQILLTPAGLDQINEISRNLGENRGGGSHPAPFQP